MDSSLIPTFTLTTSPASPLTPFSADKFNQALDKLAGSYEESFSTAHSSPTLSQNSSPSSLLNFGLELTPTNEQIPFSLSHSEDSSKSHKTSSTQSELQSLIDAEEELQSLWGSSPKKGCAKKLEKSFAPIN